MPKEITHILFAETVAGELLDGGAPWLAGLLTGQRTAYHYGAILPDTFYYALGRPGWDRGGEVWGALIHGEDGEDTAAPILETVRRARALPNPNEAAPIMALVAGYLTHMALDQVFHPWVYGVTGAYSSPDAKIRRQAMTLHRLLESWLDLHYLARTGHGPADFAPLAAIWQHAAGLKPCLHAFAGGFSSRYGLEEDRVYRMLRRGFATQARLTRRLSNATLARRLSRLSRWSGGRFDPIVALFYPSGPIPPEIIGFDGFVHPHTGRLVDARLPDLWEQARDRAVGFLRALDRYCGWRGDFAQLQDSIPGASLSMGLMGVNTDDAHWFEPLPRDRLWGYE